MGAKRDVEKLIRDLRRKHGFESVWYSDGHWKVKLENHALVVISATPNKTYALKNIKGDLRRAGYL